MTLKLSRIALLREHALDRVDHVFGREIGEKIGPLGLLHALKRVQAEAGGGLLAATEAERDAILTKAGELDDALAQIEARRLDIKAAIRAAESRDEIETILAGLPQVP